jgi:hypothetical protein
MEGMIPNRYISLIVTEKNITKAQMFNIDEKEPLTDLVKASESLTVSICDSELRETELGLLLP